MSWSKVGSFLLRGCCLMFLFVLLDKVGIKDFFPQIFIVMLFELFYLTAYRLENR